MSKEKRCPFGKCEKCIWWREFRFTHRETKAEKLEMRCGIEMLLEYIPTIQGAIDGLQGGVNEARNQALKTAQIGSTVGERIVQFARASHEALERVSHKLIELRRD